MDNEETAGIEATSPIDVVVGMLLTEAGNDIGEALILAAATIVGLSEASSYGFIRAAPYKPVLKPKPAPPPAIE